MTWWRMLRGNKAAVFAGLKAELLGVSDRLFANCVVEATAQIIIPFTMFIWPQRSTFSPFGLSISPVLIGVGFALQRTVLPVSLLITTNPETGVWYLIKLFQHQFPYVILFGFWIWDEQVCSWLDTSAPCFVPIHLVLYDEVTWLAVSVPVKRADFGQ